MRPTIAQFPAARMRRARQTSAIRALTRRMRAAGNCAIVGRIDDHLLDMIRC